MKPAVRIAILPVALLAASAGLWLLIGQPAVADLPEIRRELAERRGLLEAYSTGSSQKAATIELQADLDAAMPRITAAGVGNGRELDVIVNLEQLAQKRGVAERLSLGEPEPAGRSGWNQRDITIEISGPFPAVAQYLADLRQLPWLLSFNSLNLTRQGSPDVRATLSGSMLWLPKN